MNRRKFLRDSSIAGLTAALAGVGCSTAEAASDANLDSDVSSAPRQVVIFMTDQTRKDMLNCYRLTGLQTPNLDRIANEGIRYQRAYTTQPVCAPARSAMFTGVFAHSNGCWGNSMPLGNTVHTVGQLLSDSGVRCGYIGKWHLDGFDYFGTGRASPGWDASVWYDQRNYLEELSTDDRRRSRQPSTSRDWSLKADFTFAYRCSSRAIEFIKKNRQRDFLLVVSYDEPHDPYVAPPRYRDLYREYGFVRSINEEDSLKDKPEEQRVWANGDLEGPVKAIYYPDYFGALTFVDSQIGRVLDEIDQSVPQALILYTSDHGDMLKSHRLQGKGPAMYNEITNVPFLARWRGHTPKNVSSDVPVSHIDMTGTVLEYFGLPTPRFIDGGSMLASIKDPNYRYRNQIFVEFGRYEVDHDGFGGFQPIRCICDGRYKLSIHLLTTDEFYDMQTDPYEMKNLIDSEEHSSLRDAMHDSLLAWMDSTRDPFRGYYWGRRTWRSDFPITWENHGMTRQREDDGYLPRELDYDTGLPMKSATRPKRTQNPR